MATDTPGSQGALREANLRRVLRAVQAAGSLTQAEIVRSTGLSAATVSNLVRELQAGALVVVTPTATGRRAQNVSLSQLKGLAIGIEMGQTHLRGAICDMGYRVLTEQRIDDIEEWGMRPVEWLVSKLLQEARVDRGEVRGVGVSVPGPLDPVTLNPVTGGARSMTPAPSWQGVDITAELSGRLGLPVQLITTINAAALGELACGASRSTGEMVYVQLSTSVEAALVIRGEVYPGSSGLAGQFGHITIDESGQVCHCGNHGCLETVVGGPHLLNLLPRSAPGRPTLRELVLTAVDGDLGSRKVIGDAGRAVGTAAAMLCNVLNPRQIVLGGELARAGELLLNPIRQVLRRRTLPAAAELVEVRCGELGDRAAVVGALATVVRGTDVIDCVGSLRA